MTKNNEVNEFIDAAAAPQQALLIALRELIEKSVPNAIENYKWSRPVYTTTKDFCYLKTAKKYVTLGFMNFEKLVDQENLLEGTGKQMRHIKIASAADMKPEIFAKMLQEAAKF